MLAAVAVLAPAGALASGCGAGQSQYVDPLQNCNGSGAPPPSSGKKTTHPSTPPSSATPVSSGTPNATTANSTPSTTPSSTASTASGKTSDPGSKGKSLPYTGLDLAPALLVAFALVGGGFVLRRVVRD